MAKQNKTDNGKAFLADAYGLDDKDSMVEFYGRWADDYDQQMMDNLHYLSPVRIAQLLIDHLKEPQPDILDIGCGTGLTSQPLHDHGFDSIDGLDFSADMLRVAEKRKIYRKLIQADLNLPLVIDDNQYHAVISSGTFTHGHVNATPITEIFRILKRDGLLACTIHKALWQTHGFEACLDALENNGNIRCLCRNAGAYFEGGDDEGWFCIYQKL